MRAAVLGSPVRHSLSPALHRAAYRALDLAWTYDAIEMAPEGLAAFLAGLGPDWAGLSLTMPLKTAVLPLLDGLSDLAAQVGAANTVLLEADSRRGHNTDVHGIIAALAECGVTSVSRGVILGGGATACSAMAALAELGERHPLVATRSEPRADTLAAAGRLGVTPRLEPLGPDILSGCDVLVSTLPPGAADELAGHVARVPTLLDVVYGPQPTRLAAACQGTVVPGALMLLHQAAAQVELMTGRAAPLAAMREALKQPAT